MGSLNFDTSEARILVNEKGMPVDIVVRERGTAERMIESFMLAANECVAEHFAKAKLPFIYRIHEEPKAEKLQRFMDYASIFGVQIKGTANKMDQLDLQRVYGACTRETRSGSHEHDVASFNATSPLFRTQTTVTMDLLLSIIPTLLVQSVVTQTSWFTE